MTDKNKETIWNILSKYDNTLTQLGTALSNILQSKDVKDDYLTVFNNYIKIDLNDTKKLDNIIGSKILFFINQ